MKADTLSLSRTASVRDVVELTKPRITLMVVITAAVGLLVALPSPGDLRPLLVVSALGGTLLLAAGSSALNMWLERTLDARMVRTRDRPLPAGRMRAETAAAIGWTLAAAGAITLVLWVNALTAVLGVLTLVLYLHAYTPLKVRTAWSTVVGAVPGALPPLMGWTAARGVVEPGGWALFALLFFWQLPHFYAIAWIYRQEYRAAGFKMITSADDDGSLTARAMVFSTVLLVLAAAAPIALGLTGWLYAVGSSALAVGFLWRSLAFLRRRTATVARGVLLYSVLYLPLSLLLLVVDHLI